jgi:hypothetical protein
VIESYVAFAWALLIAWAAFYLLRGEIGLTLLADALMTACASSSRDVFWKNFTELQAFTDARPKASNCTRPPRGWVCTRDPGHSGPCAAVHRPVATNASSHANHESVRSLLTPTLGFSLCASRSNVRDVFEAPDASIVTWSVRRGLALRFRKRTFAIYAQDIRQTGRIPKDKYSTELAVAE